MNEKKTKTRRVLMGKVTSDKMQKTVAVLIERRLKHPKYSKYILRHTKVFAHDPDNVCKIGDQVLIEETRPLSKHKHWMLVKIIHQANQVKLEV